MRPKNSSAVARLRESLAAAESKLAVAIERREGEIGKLATLAGLSELALDDAELEVEFREVADRFRRRAQAKPARSAATTDSPPRAEGGGNA